MSSPSKYERTSADGTTLYTCPICIRIEVNSYEAWLWHLGSREHQLRLSRCENPFMDHKRPFAKNTLQRCVDVHGILGLDSHKVLNYMKTWGEVEDFSYFFKNEGENGKAVRCICLYRDQEAAGTCINRRSEEYEGKTLRFSAWKAWFWGKGSDGGKDKRSSWPKDRGSIDKGSFDSRKRKSEGKRDEGDEKEYTKGSYKNMRLY